MVDYNFRNKSTLTMFNERWSANHNKRIKKGINFSSNKGIGLKRENGNIKKNDVVDRLRGIK